MNLGMKKNILLIVTLLVGLTACVSAQTVTSAAGNMIPKDKIILKFGAFSGASYQPYIADKLGYFNQELKPYNAKMEVQSYASGPQIRAGLESGELSFGTMGAQPTIRANNDGTKLRIIGNYKTSEKSNAMVARTVAHINQLADLKGKRIGYTEGSLLQTLMLKILDKGNVAKTEVTLYPMGAAQIIDSLKTGKIDAGMLWEPHVTHALKTPGLVKVVDGTGLVKEVGGYNATADFIQKNPKITQAVLRALNRAELWSEKNRTQAISYFAMVSNLDFDEAKALFDMCDGRTRLSNEQIKVITDSAKTLYAQGLIKKAYKGEEIVDTSIQKAIGLK